MSYSRHIFTLFLLIGLWSCQAPIAPYTAPAPTPEEIIPVMYPAYSRRILFSAAGDLHIMHANGAGRQNLTPDTTDSNETMPAWSPDGHYIAFVSDREGHEEIYLVPADAPGDITAQINLSQHPKQDHSPAWSRDGRRLAFTTNRDSNWSISVVDVALNMPLPTNPVLIGPLRYTHNTRYDGHPTWSPDNGLAISRNDGYRWRAVQIHEGVSQPQIINGTESLSGALHPHWSPDGGHVVVAGLVGTNWDIYLVDTLNSTLQQLTTHPNRDWWPRWSPDSEYVVFVSERSGNGDIYVVHVASAAVFRLTDSADVEVFPEWEP